MRTVIDVDDEALAGAMKVLGTKTKVETINAALRHVAEIEERVDYLRVLDECAQDLGDPDVMRGAWR